MKEFKRAKVWAALLAVIMIFGTWSVPVISLAEGLPDTIQTPKQDASSLNLTGQVHVPLTMPATYKQGTFTVVIEPPHAGRVITTNPLPYNYTGGITPWMTTQFAIDDAYAYRTFDTNHRELPTSMADELKIDLNTGSNATATMGDARLKINGAYNYVLTLYFIDRERKDPPVFTGIDKVYDGVQASIGVEGKLANDTIEYMGPDGEWTQTAPVFKDVTDQTVRIRVTNSWASAKEYETTVTVRIRPKSVDAKVSDRTINAGDTLPAAADMPLTITGAFTEDEAGILSGIRGGAGFAITMPPNATNTPGQHNMILTGPAEIGNYAINYTPGILTVIGKDRPSLPTVNEVNKVYDGKWSSMSVSGTIPGDSVLYRVFGSGAEWSPVIPSYKDVTTEVIEVMFVNPSYNDYIAIAVNTVIRQAIQVKVNDYAMAVGDSLPAAALMPLTVQNAVSDDIPGILTAIRGDNGFRITTSMPDGAGVGVYDLYVTGPAQLPNYTVTYAPGKLTVTAGARPMTPVIHPVRKEYDGKPTEMTVSGTVPGDKVEFKLPGGAWSTDVPSYQDVMTQTVEVQVTNENYHPFADSAENMVWRKDVIVQAGSLTLGVGEPLPAINTIPLYVTGAIMNEDSVVIGQVRLGAGFAITSPGLSAGTPGTFDLVVTGPAQIQNYNVTYQKGTLITELRDRPSVPTVTPVNKTYDGNTYEMSISGLILPGDSVEYQRGDGSWTSVMPSYQDVQTEEVVVRVTNPKYATHTQSVINKITRRLVTVKADNLNLYVGQAIPAPLDYPLSVSGAVAQQEGTVLGLVRGGAGFSLTTEATAGSPAGTYPVVLAGPAEITNYEVVYEDGLITLSKTVRPGDMKPVFKGVNKTYDGESASITVTRRDPEDEILYETAPFSDQWTDQAPSFTNAMDVPENVRVQVKNRKYETYIETVSNMIFRRELTVSVNGATRPYGKPNPEVSTLTLALSGHVPAELGVVDKAVRDSLGFAITINATLETPVGTADILVDGAGTIPNYTVTYVPGVLTITKGIRTEEDGNTPIITPVNKEYDGLASTIGVTRTLEGDAIQFLVDGNLLDASPVYRNAMDASQVVEVVVANPNYEIYSKKITNMVTRRAISARVNDASRPYGQPNPAASELTIALTEVVDGEEELVDGEIRGGAGFGITSPATETSAPGLYDLIIKGPLQLTNYTVEYLKGTLTVTSNTRPDDMMPEIKPVNKVYDGLADAVAVITKDADDKVEYLIGGQWVETAPSYKDAMNAADTVEIRVTNPKYDLYTGTATSQVTHAPLKVRAEDKVRAYGDPTPAATVVLSGAVNGEQDALTTAIYTAPGFTLQIMDNPMANAGSALPIQVSGMARWGNYAVTYENGTLRIEKGRRPAGQEPTATGVDTVYDGKYHYIDVRNITPQDNVEYLVDGEWTVVSPAFYAYTPTAVGIRVRVTNPNYATVELDTTNVVHRAEMTVTADSRTAAYGQAFPLETFRLAGPVPADYGEMRLALLGHGDFILKTDAHANPVAGTRIPIRISGPAALGNYNLTYVPGELVIEPAQRAGDLLPKVTAVNTIYDAQDHKIGVENLLSGDKVEYLLPGGAWTEEAPVYHNADDAQTVRVRVTNDNYKPYETVTVNQVKPARLVVTADNKSRAYGAANPPLTITLNGPISSEYTLLEQQLRGDTAFSLTAADNPTAPAGTEIPIRVSGPRSIPNYTVEYVGGILSVGKTMRPDGEKPTVTPVWQAYDGKAHAIGIAGSLPSDTIEYSYGTGGWTKIAPSYLNAMDAPQRVIVRFTNPGYAPYQVETSNQIFRAQVVATADDKTRKYGEENPLFTFTTSGAVPGEEDLLRALIRTSGQYYLDTKADELTPVSNDNVIAFRGGATLGNYAVTYNNGILTIVKGDRPAGLMPEIHGVRREYDGDTYAVSVIRKDDDDVVEFYHGGTWTTQVPTYKTAMDMPESVPVRVTSPRYETFEGAVVSQITHATLKVSADNKSRAFGEANPPLTISVAGKLAGELEALKDEILGHSAYRISTEADETTPVGTAPIVVSGPDKLTNYVVKYFDGILSIGKEQRPEGKLPTIVAVNRVYDTKDHRIQVTGLLPGDKVEYSDGASGWTETAPVYHNAMDSAEIVWVRVTNENYAPYQTRTSNQIRHAHVLATPQDETRAYGAANPAFRYALDNVIGGEEGEVRAAIEGGSGYYLGTEATEKTPVGEWPIKMSGPLKLTNYRVSYDTAVLTITKAKRPASLMPEVGDIDRVYDGQSHALVVTTKDKQDTAEYFYDNQWQVDPPQYLDAMDAADKVPVRVTNPNYEDFDGEGSAQIHRARLTVAADNASRGFGEPNPAFDITVSGPVQGELSSLKAEITGHGDYEIGSVANAETPSGTDVPITVTGPEVLKNYNVNYLPGTLSVGKAKRPDDGIPVIEEVDTVYDAEDHRIFVDGLLDGDVVKYSLSDGTFTETAPVYHNAFDTVDIILVRVENPNYEPYQAQTNNIVRRREVQAQANDKSRPFGTSNPALTYSVYGMVAGEEQLVRDAIEGTSMFRLETKATTTTPIGTEEITFSSIGQTANYIIIYSGGVLTITGGGTRPDGLKPVITVPKQPYDGEEHRVETELKDPDDEIQYYYDGGWHDTPPTYKDAMDQPEDLKVLVTNPKYEPYEDTVHPHIWRAALTVRADDKSREFGAPNPPWSITVTGPVEDELDMLHDQLVGDVRLRVTMPDNPSAPAGSSLAITIDGPTPFGNYDVTYHNGTLRVGLAERPADKIPTITPVDVVYDAENHYIAVTDKIPGDVVTYRTEHGSYTTVAPVFRDVTEPPVTIWVRVTNPDYEPYEQKTTNIVRRATITAKADDKTVPYGQAFPKATFTLTGPVPADLVTMELELINHTGFSLAIDPAVTPQAGDVIPIRIGGPDKLLNYNLRYENGNLTVEKARRMGDMLPKITAVDTVYDADDHLIGVDNLLGDDTVEYLLPGGSWTTQAPVYHDASAAQTVRVRVSNPNYLDYETITVNQIHRAKLVVTADNKRREYGAANPPLTISLDGPILDENAALEVEIRNNGDFRLTAAEDPAAPVGSEIPIVVKGPTPLTNYDVSYVNGILSVGKTQRPVSEYPVVTQVWTPYTGEEHLIGISGTHPEDTVMYSYGGNTWTRIAPVYFNAMNASQKVTVRFTNPNFEPYQVETDNLVWHAPATAKANDATRKYGAENPVFSYTLTGAVKEEESALRAMIRASGQYYLGANADENTPVQDGIVIEFRGDEKLGNYAVTYENGELSIVKGDRPSSLIPDIYGVRQEYDGQAHSVSVIKKDNDETVEFYYDGQWRDTPPSYTNAMDQEDSVPVRVISPRYEDYNSTVVSQITHAKLKVAADNKSKPFGAPNPAFTITVSGKLDNELDALKAEILGHDAYTITADADETTAVGEVPIEVNGPKKLTNYTVEYINGILAIGKTDRPETSLPLVTPVDRAYDGKSHVILVEGLLDGDVVEFSDGNGWQKASPSYLNAMDDYESIWVRVTNENYAPYQVETKNQIRRAYVLASAVDDSRKYGESNPVFAFTLSETVEDEEGLVRNAIMGHGRYYLDTDAREKTPVGRYVIDLRGPSLLRNYTVAYKHAWLTIEQAKRPASLTPEIIGVNQEYDGVDHQVQTVLKDPNDTVEYYYDGDWRKDPPKYKDAMDTPDSVPVRVTNPNYELFEGTGSSQITRAKLEVRAENASRGYGEANPELDILVSGPVSWEIADLKAEIKEHNDYDISTAADENTPSGSAVPILVEGPGTLKNYTVIYYEGTLSVGIADRPDDAIPTVEGFDTVYDGQPHIITVDGLIDGDQVKYSDGYGGWTTDVPQYINAMEGPQKVIVRVENSNYKPYEKEVEVFIGRRPIIATAGDAGREYGQPNPTFTMQLQNVVTGEAEKVEGLIRGDKTFFSLDTDATILTKPGTATIVLTGPSQIPNYTVTYENGTLTITKAAKRPDHLNPDIEGVDETYDGEWHPVEVTPKDPDDEVEYYYDGGWHTDPPKYKDATETPEDVPIRVTNPKYEDYEDETTAQIRKAKLTVSAENKSRDYGAGDPLFTLALNGSVPKEHGDLEREIRGAAGFSLSAPDSHVDTPAGTEVDIVVDGIKVLPNYTVSYVNGKLSIGKTARPADKMPEAKNVNTPYDGKDHVIELSKLIEGEDRVLYNAGAGWSTIAPVYHDAMGTAETVQIRIENDNYQPVTLTTVNRVTHAPVAAKAIDESREYGKPNPTFRFTLSGVVTGEEAAVEAAIRGNAARFYLGTSATETTKPGTAAIELNGPATLKNYTVTYENGTLTITKAAKRPDHLNPDIEGVDETYDGEWHPVEVTPKDPDDEVEYYYDGGWHTDPPEYKDATETPEDVPIRVTNPKYEDYEDETTAQIRKAKLTVSAENKSRAYGAGDPLFTLALNGPVPKEHDDLEREIRGAAGFSLSAPDSHLDTPAGTDVDIVVEGVKVLPNYTVSYVNGKLSIGKTARPADKMPEVIPVNKTYDGQAGRIEVTNTIDGEDVVEFLIDGVWVKASPVYRQAMEPEDVPVRVTNPNYDAFQTTTTNVIRRAPLTAKAQDAARRYGEDNPTFTITLTGAVGNESGAAEGEIRASGDFALGTTATPQTPVGTKAVIGLKGPRQITNYTVTYVDGALTITKGVRPDGTVVEGIEPGTEYDGNEHGVEVEGELPGDKITWSDDGGETWNDGELPDYTDATGDGDPRDVVVKIENDNYETVIKGPVPVVIERAKLSVKADDLQRKYREANPPLTLTLTGAAKAEGPALEIEIRGHVDFILRTAANAETSAGSKVPIELSGPARLKNYDVAYTGGTLTVLGAQRPSFPDIIGPGGREYDGEDHEVIIDGKLPGDEISWSDDGGKTWNEGDPPKYHDATQDGEPKDIIVKVENPDYDDYISGPVPVEILRKPLKVIAEDKERMYGEPNGIFTFALQNVIVKEDVQVRAELTGSSAFGLACAADAATHAGTKVAITAAGPARIRNYSVTYESGALTVTKRPLRVIVESIAVNEGEEFKDKLKVAFSAGEDGRGGIVNNDDERIGVQYVLSAPNPTPVGTYPLTVRLSRADDYDVKIVPATLTVLGQVNYMSNYPSKYPANEPWANTSYVDDTYYAPGDNITLPDIAKTGFQTRGLTFKGWEIDGKTYNAGDTVPMGSGKMIFRAVWTVNQYTLTVQHLVKDSSTTVAPEQKTQLAYGQAYKIYSVQHAQYKAEKESESGVMQDSDLTVVMYYTATNTGGNNGGNTGGSTGGSNGGNTGGSTGGGTGGSTGGGSTGGGSTGGGSTGGGSTGGGSTGGTGSTGGGTTGGGTQPTATIQELDSGSGAQQYTIMDDDVPLGGITARNVGHCCE